MKTKLAPHHIFPTAPPRAMKIQPSLRAWSRGVLSFVGLLALLVQPTPGHADGVTLITHGANPSGAASPTWMASMRDAIATNFLGGAQCYGTITVTGSVGALVASCSPWNIDMSAGSNSDIIVVLDWTAVASHSTTGVNAQSVAAAVVDKIVTGQNGQRALAELPIHLIGHSRGGGLVCELARLLGERGVVVDHLTPLDPHPLTTSDPLQPSSPVIDTPVAIYENVVFADVYVQTNAYPTGQSIPGGFNRIWGTGGLIGGYHNNSWPYSIYADHRNMMLLYQGTVTLTNPMSNSEATMGATERAAWFNTYEAAGTNIGFAYSRLNGGGDRSSTNQSVANGDAIRAGLNSASVFGGGGVRSNLTWSLAVWPNVARLDVLTNGAALGTGTYQITVGSTQQLRYACLDYDSGCTITLHADTDRNPYNNNDASVISTQVIVSATGSAYAQNTVVWNTSALTAGATVYVYAQVTDGTRTRFLYAQPALHLVAATTPQPGFASIRRSGSSLIFTGTNGQPHATFYVLESTNVALPMNQWPPVLTNAFDASGDFAFTNNFSPNAPRKFYRLSF
jgi:hypothetical protein